MQEETAMNGKTLIALAVTTAFGALSDAAVAAKDDIGDRHESGGALVPCSLHSQLPT